MGRKDDGKTRYCREEGDYLSTKFSVLIMFLLCVYSMMIWNVDQLITVSLIRTLLYFFVI